MTNILGIHDHPLTTGMTLLTVPFFAMPQLIYYTMVSQKSEYSTWHRLYTEILAWYPDSTSKECPKNVQMSYMDVAEKVTLEWDMQEQEYIIMAIIKFISVNHQILDSNQPNLIIWSTEYYILICLIRSFKLWNVG